MGDFGKTESQRYDSLSDVQKQNASPELKANIVLAKSSTPRMNQIWDTDAELLKERFKALHDRGIHVIMTPTTLTTAPKVTNEEQRTGKSSPRDALSTSALTCWANVTGTASVSIPIGQSNKGLPVGAMLTSTSDQVGILDLARLAVEIEGVCLQKDNREKLLLRKPDIYIDPDTFTIFRTLFDNIR